MSGFRFLELALAAGFGFFSALIVAWLKSARDDHVGVFDAIIDQVSVVADLGTDYWLSADDEGERQKLEARIVGAQTDLQHHLTLAAQRLRPHQITPLSLQLARFIGALSGGDFGTPGRKQDVSAAKDCQIRAAEFRASLRMTFGQSVGLLPMFQRFIRWPHVNSGI